jgi:hypothetical protein
LSLRKSGDGALISQLFLNHRQRRFDFVARLEQELGRPLARRQESEASVHIRYERAAGTAIR